MKNPSKNEKRPTIRMPTDLHEQLVAAAKYNGTTFNAEVLHRLTATVERDNFDRLFRENAEIKQLLRELLDKA
jgi:hypothetical protein